MTDLLERLATRAPGRHLAGGFVVSGLPAASEVGAQVDGQADDGTAVWVRYLDPAKTLPTARGQLAKLASFRHPAYPVFLGHGEEDGDPYLVEKAQRGSTAAQLLARARSEGRGAPAFFVVDPDETLGRTGNIPQEPYWRAICRIVTELGRCCHGIRAQGITPTRIAPTHLFCRLDGIGIVRTLGLVGPALDDPREEVLSLGGLLYELVTLVAIEADQEKKTRPPRQIEARINAKLETIVQAAIAPSPAARYRDVAALAADLDTYLMHKPIAARRPGWFGRLLGRSPRAQ